MRTYRAGCQAALILPSFPDNGLLKEDLIEIVAFYLVEA